MARRASARPTEGELEILRVLWERDKATVREVNDQLNLHRSTGYTTTLKLMQIMLDKGLLRRDESRRPQVYAPTVSKLKVRGQFVGDLLERVFDGSTSQLVMQVLSSKDTTPENLSEIRRALDEMEKENR